MTKFWEQLTNTNKAYVIAEAGVNHLGSLELGERLIKEASLAGADSIKFQSYKAANLTTKNAPRFWDWEGEINTQGSQFDSYSLLDSFGYEEHKKLKRLCTKYDIEYLSTPFDEEAADYLEKLDIPAFKIASCDITNLPFLEYVSHKRKTMLLSTGASTIEEIQEAVSVIENSGNFEVVIMHCNLCYPTEAKDSQLNAIKHLQKEFPNYPIGLSDHTLGIHAPAFARALGAILFEKHYTVDKTLGKSADHWLSGDPPELKSMIKQIRLCEEMLGTQYKKVGESEIKARNYARRSIVSAKKLTKGTILSNDHLTFKRPGTGISPKFFKSLIGATVNQDLDEDEIFDWSMIES